jgi:hypothetical protein
MSVIRRDRLGQIHKGPYLVEAHCRVPEEVLRRVGGLHTAVAPHSLTGIHPRTAEEAVPRRGVEHHMVAVPRHKALGHHRRAAPRTED